MTQDKALEYSAGADYLVAFGTNIPRDNMKNGDSPELFRSFPHHSLDYFSAIGSDIFRSILDIGSTVMLLDVELYSSRFKYKFAEDQINTYSTLEPFNQCVMDVLNSFGIVPLTIATGQGYHYVWRVDNGKPESDMLTNLGRSGLMEPEMSTLEYLNKSFFGDRIFDHYTTRREGANKRPILEEGARWHATGKLMEYLSNIVMRLAPEYGIDHPIHMGDIHTNYQDNEGINLDISSFEAPIQMRDIRVPFTTHQKQLASGNKFAPVRVAIPRFIPAYDNIYGHDVDLPLEDLVHLRDNYWDAHNFAQTVRMEIPENATGVARMINSYLQTELAQFHEIFDYSSPDYKEIDWQSNDWLNPNTWNQMVETLYSGSQDPVFAKQLGMFVGEKIKFNSGWPNAKYPSFYKGKQNIRVQASMFHSNNLI